MAMDLIIKGAIYKSGDYILKPHCTGYFYCVDCDTYRLAKDIRADYSKENFLQIVQNNEVIQVDGKKYFYIGDYSPFNCDSMELLSDLSDLSFNEENNYFKTF